MADSDEAGGNGGNDEAGAFTYERKVKSRPSRISSKNQITLPVHVLASAGLRAGDLIRVRSAGPGSVVLEAVDDPIADLAGRLDGAYEADELDRLRD